MASLEKAIRLRIDNYKSSLNKKTDEELGIIFIKGFEEALRRDKDERVQNEFWQNVVANNIFYEGIAAKEILQKRQDELLRVHDEMHIVNLLYDAGYSAYFNKIFYDQVPQNIIEKTQVYYFMSGDLDGLLGKD